MGGVCAIKKKKRRGRTQDTRAGKKQRNQTTTSAGSRDRDDPPTLHGRTCPTRATFSKKIKKMARRNKTFPFFVSLVRVKIYSAQSRACRHARTQSAVRFPCTILRVRRRALSLPFFSEVVLPVKSAASKRAERHERCEHASVFFLRLLEKATKIQSLRQDEEQEALLPRCPPRSWLPRLDWWA